MSKTIIYDSQGSDITCMKEFDALKYPCKKCDRTDCEERKHITVGNLIKNKDYDYISWRTTLPEKVGSGDTFFGCTKSENGKLVPLDGDIYSEDTEVLSYEEWSNEEEGIKNGLTIVCERKWISG